MTMIRLRSSMLAGVCAVLALGCTGGGGDPPPKTYPVSGSVLYNGQPVVGAKVAFWNESSPKPATGITDKDGNFQLSTFAANDGAVAGEHKITVVKEEAGTGKVDTSVLNDPAKMAAQYNQQREAKTLANDKQTLPVKFASQSTTTLKETVKAEGGNQFPLQLSD